MEIPMITLNDVTKRYGNLVAVDSISFTVQPGEVLGFLGPNGAGKSTTMKMITGFLTPTEGTISVCGHDILAAPLMAKQEIGYLPEGAPAYGDMTVIQFLNFIAAIRQLDGKSRKHRIAETIEKTNIKEVLHQPIETLSKGFKRRVGLAQAILHDPHVLILDEPTDGLDPNQKHDVRKLIKEMSSDKIIIISTHILEEVSAVCTRAIVIAHGKLVADDKPHLLEAESIYNSAVTLSLKNIDEAMQELAKIESVLKVDYDPITERITAFPKQGENIFYQISSLLQLKKWEVTEFHLERGRFDEVFRSITTQHPKAFNEVSA
jgi:ABC-2 type transport system ATP-binding protein